MPGAGLAGDPHPTQLEWKGPAIMGLFLLLGGNGGVVWAEQRVPSGVTAIVVGSAPLWMVLIDALRPGGMRPTRMTLAGVLLGFAGIILLISPWEAIHNGLSLDPLGTLALLMAALFWAIGSLYSRQAPLPASPLLGTGMEMLAGGAGLLLLGTLVGEWGRLDVSTLPKTVKSVAEAFVGLDQDTGTQPVVMMLNILV